MLKVSVLFHTFRTGRKILDRVLSRKIFRSHCGCVEGLPAWLALTRCPWVIQSSAVSLSKFRMLTRWYRLGSCSHSLNNKPMVLKLRLPLLRRHRVGFPRLFCDGVPTVHGFARAVCCFVHLRELTFFPYFCTTFETILVPSGNDAERHNGLGLLD